MPARQFPKTLEEASALTLDELEGILVQPALPLDHPNAATQRLAKSVAGAAFAKLQRLCLKELQEIISQPPLPPEHPNAAIQSEAKRTAQIQLLNWNAHYGPGGPYEGSGPVGDSDDG